MQLKKLNWNSKVLKPVCIFWLHSLAKEAAKSPFLRNVKQIIAFSIIDINIWWRDWKASLRRNCSISSQFQQIVEQLQAELGVFPFLLSRFTDTHAPFFFSFIVISFLCLTGKRCKLWSCFKVGRRWSQLQKKCFKKRSRGWFRS